MACEYKSTVGTLRWDDTGSSILGADDPAPPEGDGWDLVTSSIGEMRYSAQPIVWAWRRRVRKAAPADPIAVAGPEHP